MFRSAVFKLTLLYAAIIMAISLVFSTVLYQVAVHELHTGIYNQYTRLYNAYQPFNLRQPRTTPSQEVATRSHHVLLQIVYFNLLVLVLASLASYMVARRTLRPIEAAHEQQKRFTADVSHELRTPLTSLRMESEVALLSKSAKAKDLRATLESNLEDVRHMETLINNLLLLSSMEAGKLRNDFIMLDLDDIVSQAIATTSKLAANKHIAINFVATACKAYGDISSLTQLCTILLENAIKYSPDGSAVTVTLKAGKQQASLSIHDKGPGIPLSDLPHVFDRFYRSDTARTVSESHGSTQGFGLGLSLAKLIADLHNGEIVLTSTPGKGTEARLLIPNHA